MLRQPARRINRDPRPRFGEPSATFADSRDRRYCEAVPSAGPV